MNQLAPIIAGPVLLAIVASADHRIQLRFVEFFTVTIRNFNTRKAYGRAAAELLGWREARVWRRPRPRSRCTFRLTSRS